MIAIAAPSVHAQDGDEVYAELGSGERMVRLMHTVEDGFMLQSYNPAYAARFVKPKDLRAMHVILYSRRRDC